MEIEKESRLPTTQPSSQKSNGEAQSTTLKDLPNIRLHPEQIEEIHADEYSLKLFYATRVQALSLGEVKRRFPEPTPKKALSVLTRYVDCGLLHITSAGKYYSNFPENYINYSDYKYDSDLEAKKDAKVFEIMKENTGKPEYWKTRAYYSIDSFFTPEQTMELKAMFQAIKFKSKQFAHDNAKKGKIDGLNFRRLKFYDMILSLLFVFNLGIVQINPAHAGNDPGIIQQWAQRSTNIYPLAVEDLVQRMYMYQPYIASEGNDPGGTISQRAIRVTPFKPINGVTFNPSVLWGQDSFNFKGDWVAGATDPDISFADDDIEFCAYELDESAGELAAIGFDCLAKFRKAAAFECDQTNDESYCLVAPKVEQVILGK